MKIDHSEDIIAIGQLRIRYFIEGRETNGMASVFEVTVPPDAKVPAPHHHVGFDETICGVEGACTFSVDGRETIVGPGQAIFIPRGVPHHFVNRGRETVRFIATVTPGVLDSSYFRELAAAVNTGAPPDMGVVVEIMRRHGLHPCPPEAG